MTGHVIVTVPSAGATITAPAAAVDARLNLHRDDDLNHLRQLVAHGVPAAAQPPMRLIYSSRIALLAVLASHDTTTRKDTTP